MSGVSPGGPGAPVVDVLVIGGGRAGLAAAEAAVDAGAPRVMLVDSAPAGQAGWSGRLAVAALAEAARAGAGWEQAGGWLRAARIAVVDRHADRARRLQARAGGRLITVAGSARFVGPGTVAVEPCGAAGGSTRVTVRARRVVVATGSTPCLPEVTGLLDTAFITPPDLAGLLESERPPSSLAVLGAGPTGCALAQGLARLGASVTLVEARPGVLPREDPDAAALVEAALREDGVRVLTGSAVVKLAPTLDGGAWVGIEHEGDVAAERLVLCAGWRPSTSGLQLAVAGAVVSPSGAVVVDARLASGTGEVLAAGSATGSPPHREAAVAMGRVAGQNAASRRARARWSGPALPLVTATEPEVARVGLTAPQAGGIPGAGVGEAATADLDSAALRDAPVGFARVVVGPAAGGPRRGRGRLRRSGPARRRGPGPRLLGATLVAPRAGDALAALALAMQAGVPPAAVRDAVTGECGWVPALREALQRAVGRPVPAARWASPADPPASARARPPARSFPSPRSAPAGKGSRGPAESPLTAGEAPAGQG